MSSQNDVTLSAEKLVGRVKWFNNKVGYGFITVTDGARAGSDIFVHHSSINVENQQYKYLVQGEYVEFGLVKTESEKHEWQASQVSGIRGGKLMCETRRDVKIARTVYKTAQPEQESMPRQSRVPREATRESRPQTDKPRQQARARGQGPRDDEKGEWKLVSSNKAQPKPRARPPRKDAAEAK